jgi:hypothetical protein
MFRTEIQPLPSSFKISHKTRVLTIGSCFAEVMGSRLSSNKFETLSNPYGILYNPISLFDSFNLQYLLREDHFVETRERWFNYTLHSRLNAASKQELINIIEATADHLERYLQTCDVIVFTLGTAATYMHKENNFPVANCHQMPSSGFKRALVSAENITHSFHSLYEHLKKLNSNIKFVFTVSPVRHVRDTLQYNCISKSVLRLACHHLADAYECVEYFPAYEIMMDDLRDYRFYKADMIHPSEVAETYIWELFSASYFSEDTKQILGQWDGIIKAMNHQPFYEKSEAYIRFLEATIAKTKKMSEYFNVDTELSTLQKQLEKI